MEFPISQKITCKQLVDHICKELPDDFIKEHGGVIRQMKRKQLVLICGLIELQLEVLAESKETEDGK